MPTSWPTADVDRRRHARGQPVPAQHDSAQPLVLVLDDLAASSTTRRSSTASTRCCTPGRTRFHLVLSCRTDPMLPLHRYGLAGQMSEIRSNDLAMTRSEAMLLLGAHNVTLSRQLGVLAERPRAGQPGCGCRRWTSTAAGGVRQRVRPRPGQRRRPDERGARAAARGRAPTSGRDQLPARSRRTWRSRSPATRPRPRRSRHCPGRTPSWCRSTGPQERFRYHQLLAEILRYLLRREPPHRQQELVDRAAQWYFDHDRSTRGAPGST